MGQQCLITILLVLTVPGGSAWAQQQLDMEGMSVLGNQELPKALYIVPWRSPDAGDPMGRPMNSLIDRTLQPIDRDVFRREVEYFEAVHGSP